MKHSTGKPTKAEAARIQAMLKLGCVCCAHLGIANGRDIEVHHLLSGNKRMGHWFSLPLCAGHHRSVWGPLLGVIPHDQRVSIADGRKAFTRIYPSERELWEKVQDRLHEPKSWPESKRVKRVGVFR